MNPARRCLFLRAAASSNTYLDVSPTTLMKFDVAALQYLYGTNKTSSAGNDTYTFRQDFQYTSTIYDAGGNDTIVYDATSAGGKIDLRAGAWQNLGIPEKLEDRFGKIIKTYDGLVEIVGDSDSIENATGGGGNDVITGNTLSNVLTGRGGDDTIDGGSGLDTAAFSGKRADYTLTKNASGWTVTSVAEGADTLINIERFKFADSTVALDISGNAGQAYRVYQAAFDRKPDNNGLKYWMSVMDNGSTLETVASGFLGSNEFTTLYGANPTNKQFVSKLYGNVLHRTPDQSGYDYWVSILDAGTIGKIQALINFSESNENQVGVIGVIQNGIELV